MNREHLKKKLLKIRDLATLPVVASNVIQLTQNPTVSALQVADAISQDQALTSRVLKTANSAFYGFPRKITTINQAIIILGFTNIRNIVLSTSLNSTLNSGKKDSLFDLKAFWKHSLACGITSKLLAKKEGIKNSEEAFIWGLLHDLGKIVMNTYIHEEYNQAIALALEKDMLIIDAEQELFGFTHTAVGSLIADKWNLPPALIKVIRYHHNPAKDYNSLRISSIVHLADILCRTINLGNGGDTQVPVVCQESWKMMNLNTQILKKIFFKIEDEYEKATEFLEV
ncbi:putative signal transduction protein [Desulfamplus magnetovallimortis]|uniref:Putative signal transduction protein n=1 Tax=Desulfamplus magnetovallimortis TaxID=1246637 RepID=A0A1W1H742_9BACT|nr:HDOD domain-containing protein [Desulfamplus magnetovallimortis]SLM28292.1 putative signal transduction protein [Desulfamplus magnetovallimortis]